MAEDSVNLERLSGQHAAGATLPLASTTGTPPSQPLSAPFVRYWHEQSTSTLASPQRNTNQTKQKSQPNQKTFKDRAKPAMDVSIFQTPISSNAVTTIEFIKTEGLDRVVELQSSDDDEVVEVALPPKPTITIESSDDEPDVIEMPIVASTPAISKQPDKAVTEIKKNKKKQKNKRRAVSASPVPSVVSSISDDFIRGDCAAFNISRKPEEHNFDFNLHGADLIDSLSNNSLFKKTKKKKNKQKSKDKTATNQQAEPHTMIAPSLPSPHVIEQDQCFTTPKSKAKRKHDKSKNYLVSEQSIPDPDIYESDSNQSLPVPNVTETVVTELVPSEPTERSPQQGTPQGSVHSQHQHIDLTNTDGDTDQHPTPIEDNLIMGNVTGLEPPPSSTPSREFFQDRAGSHRITPHVPPIFQQQSQLESYGDGDIVPQLSRSVCRIEMERFYNKSWGGENFDHYEILRGMSRDKNLWVIDPRDRIPSGYLKRRCHYCNQVGHGYDRCWLKPRICHMCGAEGHQEPRCPKSMCLKCGSPNNMYSSSCRSCANWNRIFCNICQGFGHPAECCPDLWRRYHSTVENDGVLVVQNGLKKPNELHCSGCARRGHLAHACYAIPYSGLPLHSPFVAKYSPTFPSSHGAPDVSSTGRYFTLEQHGDESGFQNFSHQNPPKVQQKRLSASPITTDGSAKKRNISNSETHDRSETSQKFDNSDVVSSTTDPTENVLQDCEVSNTSEVVTTAKIYVEKTVFEKLRRPQGVNWLATASAQYLVEVSPLEHSTSFLSVKGLPADQEAFQAELKNWALRKFKFKDETENAPAMPTLNTVEIENEPTVNVDFTKNIPSKRLSLLEMLNRDLCFLQSDLGEPKAVYKELQYLQRHHAQLLKSKVISPKTLSNSRTKINEVSKNLNMILVGQAGLADGYRHVRQLYSFHRVISSSSKSEVIPKLRRLIGEHYHFIFNSVEREDYTELLSQYYNPPPITDKRKRNKRNKFIKKSAKLLRRRNEEERRRNQEERRRNQVNYNQVNYADDVVADFNDSIQAIGATSIVEKPARSKEHTIDQIQSLQKKLRKWNVGNEENDQWRQVLLNRLRKFQVQVKGRGLFQKQYIQLDKLMAETRKFFGEL